jgi:hypothetical protein
MEVDEATITELCVLVAHLISDAERLL